jgi:hypothetical protein
MLIFPPLSSSLSTLLSSRFLIVGEGERGFYLKMNHNFHGYVMKKEAYYSVQQISSIALFYQLD